MGQRKTLKRNYKIFLTKSNENTTHLWNVVKIMLRGNFIALSEYIRKEDLKI